MKDFLGNTLCVGDTVAVVSTMGRRRLIIDKVIKFTNKMIITKYRRCYPTELVKLEKRDEINF